ncbi:formyltetrahydrofolate deformylase [Aminobacter sp. AP02]|uniref:formyltetrahydrofolate deformylase n=1 Tax=Aminobacter sp. AP02 TaxID=2135737 RepID=UPI000D6DAC4A|nr:formyltetrahydrofolate deformylase [Aminobacter sp. AP02]PWK76941.1 formyltetrahydrofolate deformylase [Aminobacter sp. AP02]
MNIVIENPIGAGSAEPLASADHRPSFVLALSSPNRRGIVAAITAILCEEQGDITEAHQYGDERTDRFFMRIVFSFDDDAAKLAHLNSRLAEVGGRFGMEWSVRDRGHKHRIMLLVSKFDHCLVDLLYRWRTGELPVEIAAIVSNHPAETFGHIDFGAIPFHHLPISAATKQAQELVLQRLIDETATDLVVLARYMQVFSDEMSARLSGRCINIHHSFLPGFKGAKPYHQAHQRGVKLIGATAHYVTGDLDEGPIIEQGVERISHIDTADELVRKGRDIERWVLARAIRYHVEQRVFLNGKTTVVLQD